ncbi:MAG TPA: hypothetical protein VFH48_37895 [Chloroflexota bacterium]|nr:hypothetical protein [Chloroflexota bacterium]
MLSRGPLSFGEKLAVAALVVAAIGVVFQIAARPQNYPTVPPVFFILLIPAGLITFGRWRWAPIPAVLAGVFLTFGLFASGASGRLFDLSNPGDSLGLWIQMLAVVVATVAAIVATVQNYRRQTSVTAGTAVQSE